MESVPVYPASRPLGLEDKPLLDPLFAALQPRVSELTFAGLFLFRHAHAYRLTRVGDSVVLLGAGYDGASYCYPPLNGDIDAALDRLFADGLNLYGADEAFADVHLRLRPVEVIGDRDNADYLYLRQELADLAGNRFHKKKNRVNLFVNHHEHRVERFAPEHLRGALQLLEEWRQARLAANHGPSLELEAAATAEALQLAGVLGLEGLVVLVGGAVRGFVLGERLNRETSVCHFEKADPGLEGLAQLLDREFNRLLFIDCTYVNREQDLGEPGLREAKLSYHPLELIAKYRAIPRRP